MKHPAVNRAILGSNPSSPAILSAILLMSGGGAVCLVIETETTVKNVKKYLMSILAFTKDYFSGLIFYGELIQKLTSVAQAEE